MSLIEHLEKLRHFNKVTSYKSINEAAQAMGVSQAGLSKSIANLESVLETALFVRTRDGLILTKEGELLRISAKKILDEASNAEANLRSLKATSIPEKVRVGMYDSIAVYFFPHLSTYLKAIYPKVEMTLVVDSSQNLAKRLERDELDLAIGVNLKRHSGAKADFFLLFEDHYSFYASANLGVDAEKAVLIFHPSSTDETGASCEELLAKPLKTRLSHRVHNFETLKSLTALGIGVGVLPTQVARTLTQTSDVKPEKLQRFPRLFGKHHIGFLASHAFLKHHQEFAEDIYRLGQRWAKV